MKHTYTLEEKKNGNNRAALLLFWNMHSAQATVGMQAINIYECKPKRMSIF